MAKDRAASSAEAATAMRKAMELAAEHGIDLTAIPPDDPEHGGMTHASETSQAGPAHRKAAALVRRHFGVDTLFDSTGEKPVIHFIGFESNTQLALYCYTYLVRASRAAWRKRANKRREDALKARAILEALIHGHNVQGDGSPSQDSNEARK